MRDFIFATPPLVASLTTQDWVVFFCKKNNKQAIIKLKKHLELFVQVLPDYTVFLAVWR